MTVDQKFEVSHCLPPSLKPNLEAVYTPSNGGLLSHQEALLHGHLGGRVWLMKHPAANRPFSRFL